jgi:thiamine pyrophosphokinase
MLNFNPESFTVIVADGVFPQHSVPLGYLKKAKNIICCDGGTQNLLLSGRIPDAIIGDMDSLNADLINRFSDRIYRDENQDINDLTKAVVWCSKMGYTDIIIVGATGKREDHTLGNISLLVEYAGYMNVIMATDTGVFQPLLRSTHLSSFEGQQVSIFSIDPETEITSHGLRYPLKQTKLRNWWSATLNEALEETFILEFNNGRILVYQKYP